MKIAILCYKDQAGSGMMFARALRDQGHHATLYVEVKHEYGYQYDVLYNGVKSVRKQIAREQMADCDVLHFKGDQMPFSGPYKILRDILMPPAVITVGGSGFRRRSPEYPPEACQHWYPVSAYRAVTKAMGAITPDLMYNPSMVLTPHAHPEMDHRYRHHKVPALGHSPSNRSKKGTDTLFFPAVQILRDRGVRFDLKVIEGIGHAECLMAKSECSVFFDQGVIPAYGMSAVEAMMMGIPVVTRMTHEVKQRDPMFQGSPLFTFEEQSPLELADSLQAALTSDLRATSKATLEWAMEMHSYRAVCARLMTLYSKALTSPSKQFQQA